MRNCCAVFLFIAGIAIASAGLAVLFGVIAATALGWSWSGVYFDVHDATINGREIPEAALQVLLVAFPMLVMLAGAGLIALGWRARGTCRASRNKAAHRP